jgi:hypothetical protein
MEFKVNGLTVEVNPAELENDQLTGLAQEVFTAANERGLELPFATGAVAVEGAMQADESVETSLDPSDIKETIKSLLTPAYSGYQATVEQINGSRKKKEQITVADQETAEAELEEWFDEDRLAYVKKTMEVNPNLTWTLLATVNGTVTADEFLAGTKTFGEGQPYSTEIWSDIAKKYTPEEISGTDPSNGKAFKFKLVPNEFTPEIYGDVPTSKAKLTELQAEYPFLDSTSPLEDLTWLNTKRAANGGKPLAGSGTADATYMRSYGLEPKRIVRDLRVPSLFVRDLGRLTVSDSWPGSGRDARVSVG